MKNLKFSTRITDGMLVLYLVLVAVLIVLFFDSAKCESILQNKQMQVMLKPTSENNFLEFRDETNVNPLTVFTDYKAALGLQADDEMRLVKGENDQMGMAHYRYQQFYKGIKIEGAEMIVHSKDGRAVSMNGKMVAGINLPQEPSLTENDALTASLKFVKSTKYMWLNANEEEHYKRMKKDESASYFPKGELVYTRPTSEKESTPSNLILCWRFDINVEDGLSARIFVDAKTGALINSIPLDLTCSAGTGTTTFNGVQSVWTKASGAHYNLDNDCNSVELHVRNANTATDLSNVTEYTDANNIWNATSQTSAVQTMFGIRKSYYYYLTTFGRDSYDNSGSNIDCYNNAWFTNADGTTTPNNAQWSNSSHYLRFGPANSSSASDDYNADDVVGHEFTHGVTEYSAALNYQSESGALNESFSDIFGEMVENYVEGSMDWLVGADRGAIRSFLNPNLYNQPDTYNGTNWFNGTTDNGGVHTNSGVQNYFFYLLSVGGSGTNDNGSAYSVTGIGAPNAAAIGYRALTTYLSSGSQYIDARAAWLHAALDIFGSCSSQIIQVGNAWHAVGVESQSSQWLSDVCGSYPLFNSVTFQSISTVRGAYTCANSIIASPYSVTYSSDDKVVLYPGFNAPAGSHFVAYVEPCAVTLWRQAAPGDDISAEELNAEKSVMDFDSENSAVAIPNPFTTEVKTIFRGTSGERVILRITDMLGKNVLAPVEKLADDGKNEVILNTSELEPGTYFIELQSPSFKQTMKVIKTD